MFTPARRVEKGVCECGWVQCGAVGAQVARKATAGHHVCYESPLPSMSPVRLPAMLAGAGWLDANGGYGAWRGAAACGWAADPGLLARI